MDVLNYPFDSSYILKKKKAIKRELLEHKGFIQKRIAILSGSTIGEVKNILELFLLNEGIEPVFYEGAYNRFYEEAVFEADELVAFKPDIIYIHTNNKNIDEMPRVNATAEEISQIETAVITKYKRVWQGLKEKCNCVIIQNNFEPLGYRLLGNQDCYHRAGRLNFINRLNEVFYEYARCEENFYINDISYVASCYGLDKWQDEALWHMYKYAMSLDSIPYLCHNLSHIIKSIYGKNKKALVLDLDNTLWGGVIGDDGIDGIKLGNENGVAEAYMGFQKYVKELLHLGVLLNVASKNEEAIAVEGLSHPSSHLKREDFIGFKANWEPKSRNIVEIAETINLLPESLVFVDDNPAERKIVKDHFKKIAVPEITRVESYIKELDRQGYFEVTLLSEDDLNRQAYYKANQIRQERINSFEDYETYLKSLNMKCEISGITTQNIKRVTQLINKTNQFNFTTKRYTETEVEAVSKDETYIKLVGRLEDSFGDNGIVSTLFAKCQGHIATIELWIMSCRVFKRHLEWAMLDALMKQCEVLGITKIQGIYKETAKNKLLQSFYTDLGFEIVNNAQDTEVYEITLINLKRQNITAKKDIMEVSYE